MENKLSCILYLVSSNLQENYRSPRSLVVVLYAIYIRCRKILKVFVRALETDKKASL